MRSGGGGARFLDPDMEIGTGELMDVEAPARGLGSDCSIGVGGSRVTVPTRPASSSSVMFAVRSRLSSCKGMYSVSRGRSRLGIGWLVLSSVVLPPPPVELSTASSEDTPVSPLWSRSAPSSVVSANGVGISSNSSSSSSSRGSTSASRSATKRQLGHKKFGQLGP